MTSAIPNHHPNRLLATSARPAKARDMFVAAATATSREDADAAHWAQATLAEMKATRADQNGQQAAPAPVGIWAESARIIKGRS